MGERLARFLAGVEKYRAHPYRRTLDDPPTLWQEGSSRLLDFGGEGPPVVFVPSLVNRATIFDLDETCSLMRWLVGQGLSPLLLDWGTPGPAEEGYTLERYTLRLERAVAAVGVPVKLVGYCMGGVFALAAALRHPHRIEKLALLATPWDFHREGPEDARKVADFFHRSQAGASFSMREGLFPVDLLQTLFTLADPLGAARKFMAFAALQDPAEEARFVAVEDWLNEGVPLTHEAAEDCLVGWYGDNRLAEGGWEVEGMPIDPAHLSRPALVILPEEDRVIPPSSSAALALALRHRTRLKVPLGHVGLMVSRRAPALVWGPLATWLRD